MDEFNCGGGYYKPVNIQCLKDNKKDILKKCQRICTQSSTMDCVQQCEFMYNIKVNPDVNLMGVSVKKEKKEKKEKDEKDEKDEKRYRKSCGNTVYIAYSLGCVVILLGFGIIICRKNIK